MKQTYQVLCYDAACEDGLILIVKKDAMKASVTLQLYGNASKAESRLRIHTHPLLFMLECYITTASFNEQRSVRIHSKRGLEGLIFTLGSSLLQSR